MIKTLSAEVIGTFILVFFGCGSAVLMGEFIGMHGIAMAFGLAIVAAAYGLGAISGAHLNPAVTLGVVMAGRMAPGTAVGYVVAQLLGAVIGALVIYLIRRARRSTCWPKTVLARTAMAPAIWASTAFRLR